MPRLIVVVIALVAVILLLRWFVRTKPSDVARILRQSGLAMIIGVLVFLAATGHLYWLFALIGSIFALLPRLLPLLRYVPLLGSLIAYIKRKRATAPPSSGQQSRVETRFLRMTLDHDSGEMNGEILEGQYKGQRLGDLKLEQLVTLYKDYRAQDQKSAALLQAYLERVHGDEWQRTTGESTTSVDTGSMTHEEAHEILGLAADASDQEIVDAHRRLMQKLHPDRGGSTYLAAKINQAKDLLLAR